MRYYLPVRKANEELSQYLSICKINLWVFKRILQNNIRKDKLDCRKQTLLKQHNIDWKNTYNCNLYTILNIYINKLDCLYDRQSDRCYYAVSEFVKCPNTNTSLNTVIRTLEYGTTDMSPLFWLRQSVINFKEITNNQ